DGGRTGKAGKGKRELEAAFDSHRSGGQQLVKMRQGMRWWERVRMAMLMLFHRRQEAARLNAELDFHLEQQIAENVERGMAQEEARLAALRLFGNPAVLREEARSFWSWNWLEGLWRDVRYGLRTLRRSPSFSATAILVMALGIGASTSLFTIVRSVLL